MIRNFSHKILFATALCLAAVGLSSCSWCWPSLHTAEAVRTGDRRPNAASKGEQRQLDADEIAAIQRMMQEA